MPSIRDVMRGVFTRFLPGWLTGVALMLVLLERNNLANMGLRQIELLGTFSAAATTGFTLTMLAMRRWLRPDAAVTGRKSFMVGLYAYAAIIVLSIGTQGWFGRNEVIGIYGLVGAAITLGIYFPWLTRRPIGGAVLATDAAGVVIRELATGDAPVSATPAAVRDAVKPDRR